VFPAPQLRSDQGHVTFEFPLGDLIPMRVVGMFTVVLIPLACVPVPKALAEEPTCVAPVDGEKMDVVKEFHEGPNGQLLVASGDELVRYDGKEAELVKIFPGGQFIPLHDGPDGQLLVGMDNLFRYDGKNLVKVTGVYTGNVVSFHDGPGGQLLVGADHGLFRYDGKNLVKVMGDFPGRVWDFHDGPYGQLLVEAEQGLFHYDGKNLVHLKGPTVFEVHAYHDGSDGQLLVGAYNGLFRYDGKNLVPLTGPRGELVKPVKAFHDGPNGQLLVASDNALFRYDGKEVVLVKSYGVGPVFMGFHDGPNGQLLVASGDGLLRYDGKEVVPVDGGKGLGVTGFHDVPGGLLVGAYNGLFRYDGKSIAPVEGGAEMERALNFSSHEGRGGLLLGADNGLFRYDGKGVVPVIGSAEAGVASVFHDGPDGQLLVSTVNGLFRVIFEPLSASKIKLSNLSDLQKASPAPSQLGIPIRWTMIHPCSVFAEKFGLHVIATNQAGKDDPPLQVTHIDHANGTASFVVDVPVSEPGNWTFRVVSIATGSKEDIGERSEPIMFVAPVVTPGFIGWLVTWWPVIVGSIPVLLITFNLVVFARARYSAAAWRLATDSAWGMTALAPLMCKSFNLI
jgi:ligand-binding sensor domain-containing protein